MEVQKLISLLLFNHPVFKPITETFYSTSISTVHSHRQIKSSIRYWVIEVVTDTIKLLYSQYSQILMFMTFKIHRMLAKLQVFPALPISFLFIKTFIAEQQLFFPELDPYFDDYWCIEGQAVMRQVTNKIALRFLKCGKIVGLLEANDLRRKPKENVNNLATRAKFSSPSMSLSVDTFLPRPAACGTVRTGKLRKGTLLMMGPTCKTTVERSIAQNTECSNVSPNLFWGRKVNCFLLLLY